MIEAGGGERCCAVVVLPECADVGWTHPSARQLAQSRSRRDERRLADAAPCERDHVVAGLTGGPAEATLQPAVFLGAGRPAVLKASKDQRRSISAPPLRRRRIHSESRTTPSGPSRSAFVPTIFRTRSCSPRAGAHGRTVAAFAHVVGGDADHDDTKERYGGLWETAIPASRGCSTWRWSASATSGTLTAGPWPAASASAARSRWARVGRCSRAARTVKPQNRSSSSTSRSHAAAAAP